MRRKVENLTLRMSSKTTVLGKVLRSQASGWVIPVAVNCRSFQELRAFSFDHKVSTGPEPGRLVAAERLPWLSSSTVAWYPGHRDPLRSHKSSPRSDGFLRAGRCATTAIQESANN
jgi:hypothetical protein